MRLYTTCCTTPHLTERRTDFSVPGRVSSQLAENCSQTEKDSIQLGKPSSLSAIDSSTAS